MFNFPSDKLLSYNYFSRVCDNKLDRSIVKINLLKSICISLNFASIIYKLKNRKRSNK